VAFEEERIRQVLLNLLTNALHASPSGGRITRSWSRGLFPRRALLPQDRCARTGQAGFAEFERTAGFPIDEIGDLNYMRRPNGPRAEAGIIT